MSDDQKSYPIGIHSGPDFIGKGDSSKVSGVGFWEVAHFTLAELANHIGKGYPWMPALLDGDTKRNQSNSNFAAILGADIDGDMTIEAALEHPFVKAHCGLLIESASSTPEHHKLRLVFPLAEPLTDWQTIRCANTRIIQLLGAADPACKDASRFFWGAPGRTPYLLNAEATLPAMFAQDAIDQRDAEEAAAKAECDRSLAQFPAGNNRSLELAKQAIAYILPYTPGNNTYGDLISMCFGVLEELGSAGEALLEAWGGFGPGTARKISGMKRSNGGRKAGLGSLFHLAKQNGFKFPKIDRTPLPQSPGQCFAQSKIIQFPNQSPTVSIDELPSQIETLLDRNFSISKLQVEKIKLRHESGLDPREFDQLWKAALAERDAVESDSRQLQALLNQSRLSIALDDVLPGNLGTMLNKIAKMQALRPEVYLTALLTTIGSLAQNGTFLMLHKALDYEVTPNLYGAIVADPSQKKSPVIRTLIRNPLKVLTREAKDAHRRALQVWEERRIEAKNNDEPFNEPEPNREVFYFTNSSGEAILAQVNRVPQRGLLNLSDELAGAFKSKNQYRSGRGSDGEDMLSFYDGIGGATLRVDGIRNDVGILNYGCFGGIQPKVLKKFLGNCEDENGNWARFLFCSQPLSASTLPDDFDDFDISESLTHYYRSITQFAPTQCRLTPQAFTLFQREYNRLEQSRVSDSNPAMQAVIGKSAGRIGKIALCLHLLEAAVKHRAPEGEISEKTIVNAIAITEFYTHEIDAIYADADPADQQTPILAKIVDLSRRKGSVKARDVQNSLPKLNRPSSDQIRQSFIQLAEQGYGETSGAGGKLAFTAYSERVEPEAVADVVEPIATEPTEPTPIISPSILPEGWTIEDVIVVKNDIRSSPQEIEYWRENLPPMLWDSVGIGDREIQILRGA